MVLYPKKIQSGRQICYTVAGKINPSQLQTAIDNYLKNYKLKENDVRLQENEWVRIVSSFDFELTPEEVYGENNEWAIKAQKDFARQENRSANFKRLAVKIQFLKPCNVRVSQKKTEESLTVAEQQKYLEVGLCLLLKGDEGKRCVEDIAKDPYLEEILSDHFLLPIFKCDYRTTIFGTFYNDTGTEIETSKRIPRVYWKDGKRKNEMLPGETIWVEFLMPYEATSWRVWVPK